MFPDLGFCASGKLKNILKWKIVDDQKVIKSTCLIVNTNYIVYFVLSVKTTMQPALDSLKIPILQEIKKAGRKKFWMHLKPKCGKKFMILVLLVHIFCSSEEPTESNVWVQFWVIPSFKLLH